MLKSPKTIKKLTSQIPVENLILNGKNLGYAGGNNIGIKKALKDDADFIWLLNPGIRVEKEALPRLLETILSDKSIAAVGPRICSRLNENEIFSDGGVVLYNPQCQTYLIITILATQPFTKPPITI
jgi:GT2 family glycosyltransferase